MKSAIGMYSSILVFAFITGVSVDLHLQSLPKLCRASLKLRVLAYVSERPGLAHTYMLCIYPWRFTTKNALEGSLAEPEAFLLEREQ